MHAWLALTLAHARDVARRPSTLILAAVGAVLVLSLRWFSAFGLGYEVVQLLELGVYTVGMMGAVAVVLFWLPREDETDDPESLLLTRPVSPWVLAGGAFAGRLIVVALLFAGWWLCIAAALLWFKLEDAQLFGYRGADSVGAEALKALGPLFGQFMATGVLLAVAQPIARARKPALLAAGVLALYVLGYAVALPMLPDLARQDVTGSLWGMPDSGISPWQIVHACAWCAVGIALDSGVLRLRSVS